MRTRLRSRRWLLLFSWLLVGAAIVLVCSAGPTRRAARRAAKTNNLDEYYSSNLISDSLLEDRQAEDDDRDDQDDLSDLGDGAVQVDDDQEAARGRRSNSAQFASSDDYDNKPGTGRLTSDKQQPEGSSWSASSSSSSSLPASSNQLDESAVGEFYLYAPHGGETNAMGELVDVATTSEINLYAGAPAEKENSTGTSREVPEVNSDNDSSNSKPPPTTTTTTTTASNQIESKPKGANYKNLTNSGQTTNRRLPARTTHSQSAPIRPQPFCLGHEETTTTFSWLCQGLQMVRVPEELQPAPTSL